MAQYSLQLDDVFHALSDPTRRSVLNMLARGPASVGELAGRFDMALSSFLKHIRTLERGGWITTTKTGRVRTCALEDLPFDVVGSWVDEQRQVWEERTDRFERFVTATLEEPSA